MSSYRVDDDVHIFSISQFIREDGGLLIRFAIEMPVFLFHYIILRYHPGLLPIKCSFENIYPKIYDWDILKKDFIRLKKDKKIKDDLKKKFIDSIKLTLKAYENIKNFDHSIGNYYERIFFYPFYTFLNYACYDLIISKENLERLVNILKNDGFLSIHEVLLWRFEDLLSKTN